MNPSSAKNHLVISLFISVISCLPLLSQASRYEFKIDFDAKYGTHIYGAPSTATNRHGLGLEQKIEIDHRWSGILGFRAEVESVYATSPERYGVSDIGKHDSQTFLLRDNYIQYQGQIFRLRAGYQQVVWGEAFGHYYADIVNPKDYREVGLGSQTRNRLNTPILNLQWMFSNNSIQILYIPNAGYSLMPKSGSDFYPNKLSDSLTNQTVIIDREPLDPLTRGEYGLRITQQYSPMDFSIFYLNYYDRLPIYQYQMDLSTSSIHAKPDFRPLQTQGATATVDYNGFLFRSEILKHSNRELNIIDNANITTNKSNEIVSVFGVDLPTNDKWVIGVQYSESLLTEKHEWAARSRLEKIISARIAKTLNNNVIFETMLTDFTHDSSSLIQSQITVPLSSQNEIIIGADHFAGNEITSLGRFKNASRVWLMFNATLKR